MHIVTIIVLSIVLVLGLQWWARYIFRRYADVLPRIPGTGGELARHLLDRFGMFDVRVEKTENSGDHYDPEHRAVRLSPDNYDSKSLTAVAVAAHEVGHAIDNAYRLRRRVKYREVFGKVSAPYPDYYRPKPYSKSFVLHLDAWYAQSHPDEDFAGTGHRIGGLGHLEGRSLNDRQAMADVRQVHPGDQLAHGRFRLLAGLLQEPDDFPSQAGSHEFVGEVEIQRHGVASTSSLVWS